MTCWAAWSTLAPWETAPDPRLNQAIDLLRSKRQRDGTWLLRWIES